MQTVITNTGFDKTVSLLKEKYDLLSPDGCFFAIFRTEYDGKLNVVHDFLELIHEADGIGYDYVTTIVYPSSESQKAAFIDNVKYVVWLAKQHKSMKFNKDAIREKHIWKDVEWGKRAKNYNPKGKDPGNVWIPTLDDGHAHITEHIMLGDRGVIDRLLTMSDCGDDFELISEPDSCPNAEKKECARCDCGESVRPAGEQDPVVIFKSSEDMSEIPAGSVKTIVTSPPYWNLKDYFKKGQIGQEDYATYLLRMEKVWSECFERLRPDGSLWVNINIRMHSGKLISIPYDFVRMCRKIGYSYKGILIWHKSSGIPTGKKNIVDRHEYVLVFSKSADFCVDFEVFGQIGDYKNDEINGKAFWNINRKAGSVGKKYTHPAIYPNELVSRIVAISSNEGDLIVDPFLGSGTTLIASAQSGRSFVGYEYNEGFEALMTSRFESEIPETPVQFRR